jgi:hypothetical protein
MGIRYADATDHGKTIGPTDRVPHRRQRRMETEAPTEIDRAIALARRPDRQLRAASRVGAVTVGHQHAQAVETADEVDDDQRPLGRGNAATLR